MKRNCLKIRRIVTVETRIKKDQRACLLILKATKFVVLVSKSEWRLSTATFKQYVRIFSLHFPALSLSCLRHVNTQRLSFFDLSISLSRISRDPPTRSMLLFLYELRPRFLEFGFQRQMCQNAALLSRMRFRYERLRVFPLRRERLHVRSSAGHHSVCSAMLLFSHRIFLQ